MYAYLSKYYNQIFPFSRDISLFLKPFTISKGYAIDLGCGTGRLTHVIQELGMHVIGVDLDSYMIEIANKNYPSIEFFVENMIDSLKKEKTYDLITCFGNTIVHLDSNELKLFFELVNQRLSDNGHLILQTLHYDQIMMKKPEQLKFIENEYLKFSRYYDYLHDNIKFSTRLEVEDLVFEGSTDIFPYKVYDFTHIAESNQMSIDIYGGYKFEQLTDESQHVYYVFKKSLSMI